MKSLALANILHRKFRSALSCAAVAIGIMLLVTVLSLTRGTIEEMANRYSSVEADILVVPRSDHLLITGGAVFRDKDVDHISKMRIGDQPAVREVIPIYQVTRRVGEEQPQRIFGVRPEQFSSFLGSRRFLAGRLFRSGRLEMVVDERLAKTGHFHVGQQVRTIAQQFTIVGIVENGIAARAFTSLETMRHIQASKGATMLYVKATRPELAAQLANEIEKYTGQMAVLKGEIDSMVRNDLQMVTLLVDVIVAIAVFVSFFFVLLTIYTMVLERGREIAILQSMGASRGFIMREIITETLLISLTGTVMGVLLSLVTGWAIRHNLPLLTVSIKLRWVLLAAVLGVAGGVCSALYPAWVATRREPAVVLNFE